MEIKANEILGYWVGEEGKEELFCPECAEDIEDLTSDDIFTAKDADHSLAYFCDKCKTKIF